MNLRVIDRRLSALEPIDPTEQEKSKHDRLLMEAFEVYLLERLQELGCSEILDEVKTALQTFGPRPFGHDRPDDHPYWCALDEITSNQHELAYRLRAADSLAWADLYIELGAPADFIKWYQESAASDLERDKKERQTFCDRCGQPLGSWWCWMARGKETIKNCRSCEASQ